MKLEIEIPEDMIRELVVKSVADLLLKRITEVDFEEESDWDKRKEKTQQKQRALLEKIDWKNAGSQLSETVIQKFFIQLLDKR